MRFRSKAGPRNAVYAWSVMHIRAKESSRNEMLTVIILARCTTMPSIMDCTVAPPLWAMLLAKSRVRTLVELVRTAARAISESVSNLHEATRSLWIVILTCDQASQC